MPKDKEGNQNILWQLAYVQEGKKWRGSGGDKYVRLCIIFDFLFF
jgi:hypothetical protein